MEGRSFNDPGPSCLPIPVVEPVQAVHKTMLTPQCYIRVLKDSLSEGRAQYYLINDLTLEVVPLEGDGWECEVVPSSVCFIHIQVHYQSHIINGCTFECYHIVQTLFRAHVMGSCREQGLASSPGYLGPLSLIFECV